ncbi:MAG: dNTP triphosphohydrolase [Pirellulaceae bacterium]
MSLSLIDLRESALLAPYAFYSRDSSGRAYSEPEHAYRGPFQRDRDRIVHSAAFRRLNGKMQVFTGAMGDYHRTRLTHTMEVASIARTIGRTLRLNEDLIEALALLHDIGHPPFGHAGEDTLAELLEAEGGFSHNRFALTLVREIEHPYPIFPGLNLTYEVLESQDTRADKQHSSPLLEAQVVDAADSITYDAHDVDDAVKLKLITLDELGQLPLIARCLDRVEQKHLASGAKLTADFLRKSLVHELIEVQVSDLVQRSQQILLSPACTNAQEAKEAGIRLTHNSDMQTEKSKLEAFLYQRVYRHPDIVRVRLKAQNRLRELFQAYCDDPGLLPAHFRVRIDKIGLRQTAGDYIAGMTDHYCLEQSNRLSGKTP